MSVSIPSKKLVLGKIEATSTLTTITSIITTRSVGFSAVTVFSMIFNQHNPHFNTNIYSYYRVS